MDINSLDDRPAGLGDCCARTRLCSVDSGSGCAVILASGSMA